MSRKKVLGAGLGLLLAAIAGISVAEATPPPNDVQPYIVGGHEAVGPTGWMAAVLVDAPTHGVHDRFICGGTLTFRNAVETAAHCVDMLGAGRDAGVAARFGLDSEASAIPVADRRYKVRVGSKDRTSGGYLVDVVGITIHERWQWGAGAPAAEVADVAVLHLAEHVDVQPIQIAASPPRPGDRVTMYGWGIDNPHPSQSPEMAPRRLQQLETRLDDDDDDGDCAGGFASRTDICADNVNGTDGACDGDSGGPIVRLTRNGVPQLLGVISRPGARGVCGSVQTVATSAFAYRNWVYNAVTNFPAPPATPREKPIENTHPYEPPQAGS